MFDGSITKHYQAMNMSKYLVGGLNQRLHPRSQLFSSPLSARPTSDKQSWGNGESRSFDPKPFPSIGGLNRPMRTLPKTVGVIGGLSAISTLRFMEKLIAWSSREGEDGLPLIVCSDPMLSRELSFFERSFPSYHNSRNTCSHFDHTPIVENLRHKRQFLERSGAQLIVMPCNLSHMLHAEISEGSSVPFLHVGECVAQELKEAKLKPVEAGSNLRIGILAPDSILTARFYQEKLQNQGFEAVVPDKATMDHTVIPAIEVVKKGDMEGARNLLRIAIQVLLVRAVNTTILASEDLQGLLPPDDPLLKRCIDPIDALVRSTIRWSKSTEQGEHILE